MVMQEDIIHIIFNFSPGLCIQIWKGYLLSSVTNSCEAETLY